MMFGDMFKNRKFYCWSFGNPMSLRFLPDDGDGDGDGDDAAALAIKEAEDADRKRQEDFDKAQQRADQEAANARKAREQAAQASQQLTEMKTQSEAMQKELDALKAKAGEQGIDLDESEFEAGDIKLVRAIKTLEAKQKASKEEIVDLKKTKSDFLAERKANEAKIASNRVYEDLLSDLDEEYGAQYRNAAVKQFDELCKAGKVQTGNPAKTTRALEKCYKDAKKAAEKKAKENPEKLSLDTGAGGGAPNLNRIKLKPGSLAEVSAQIRAANTG